jgi:TonB family protein
MAFDPSTLLSRTGAGDAELRTPQNGLSLAQRKLLTLLEQPQALEEFAVAHGSDPERLQRDLAKLVALNLVAVNGETAANESATVVLGGLRAPSSLVRLAVIPALVVTGAIAYFVVMPRLAQKAEPAVPTSPTLSSSAPAVAAAPASQPAAMPAVAPIVVPLQVPTAPSPSTAPHVAPAVAVAPEPKQAHAPVREAAAEPKPLPMTADVRHGEPPAAVRVPEPTQAATAAPPAATSPAPSATVMAATSPPAKPATAVPTPPSQVAASPAPAPTHAVEPAPAPAKPAAPPPKPVVSEPAKLAMAAPSAADAHPPAKVKLLPVARQDPEFPREAIVRGVTSGDVKARLSIDGAGKVTAVDIVEARPARVFDRVVRDALSHWSFPAGASGRSTEVEIAFRRD